MISGGAGGRRLNVFLAGDGVKLSAARGMFTIGRLTRRYRMVRLDAPGPTRGIWIDPRAEIAATRFAELVEDRDRARDCTKKENHPQRPLGAEELKRERAYGGSAGESRHEPKFEQAARAFVARH